MARNPLIRKTPTMTGPSKVGHKSAGILEDFDIKKNIATKEGTIEKVPVNSSDIVNKAYADAIVGGGANYWLSGAGVISTDGNSIISGAGLVVTGTISGASIATDGNIVVGGLVDGIDIAGMSAFVTANTTGRGINTNDITSLSGAVVTLDSDVDLLSGAVVTLGTDLDLLSGALVDTNTEVTSVSGASVRNDSDIDLLSGALVTHEADSTDPHGAILTQTNFISSGTISGANIIVTGDSTLSGADYVSNTIWGTDETPPTASDYTQGSVYLQYTP